jgi:hypothetical protein
MSTPNKRQATDFESEEYDELSDSSESKSTKASAKKKRYDQKVKKIWFSNPKYSQFSELTEYIVMCNRCKTQVDIKTGGLTALRQHSNTS